MLVCAVRPRTLGNEIEHTGILNPTIAVHLLNMLFKLADLVIYWHVDVRPAQVDEFARFGQIRAFLRPFPDGAIELFRGKV